MRPRHLIAGERVDLEVLAQKVIEVLAHIVIMLVLAVLSVLHVAASFVVAPGAITTHDGAKTFLRN
jgi:hypothetical protein